MLGLGSSSEEKDNRMMTAALEDDLNYCLSILKLKEYDEDKIETKIKKLYAQNIGFFNTYHKRLITLKIIADFIALTSRTLTPSQLYDFLMLYTATVSVERIKGNERLQGANDIVFKIYRDLLENYQTAGDILKLNYPRIIVDVVAVISNGIDTRGKQVSVYGVYDYYLSRKSDPASNSFAGVVVDVSNIVITSDEDKVITEHGITKNDLIQSLVRITGRNGREIEDSLARLNDWDIERIRNLCLNYPKIDKYCRFIADDRKYFIEEIERECGGKKLTKYQIQIAVISIKKVSNNIENVLDRKFVPHSSHYINHTKHNLEYGYQVMGLIESSKRGGGVGRREWRNSSSKD